jgi:hypothetical protein
MITITTTAIKMFRFMLVMIIAQSFGISWR